MGFRYFVDDERLRVFRSMSAARKLQWLDEAREFSIRTAPAHAKRNWQKLRRGELRRYELWASRDRSEHTLFDAENQSARESLREGDELLFAFDAPSWDEALAWRDWVLGYE